MRVLFFVLSLLVFSTQAQANSLFDFLEKTFSNEQQQLAKQIEVDTRRGFGAHKISLAFKDTLSIGSELSVLHLGAPGGFNLNEEIHIPLPREFVHMYFLLDRAGFTQIMVDLEHKMNRAAELTIAKAPKIFQSTIQKMTFVGANQMLDGEDDSATAYMKENFSPHLEKELMPLTKKMMEANGTNKLYERFLEEYETYDVFPKLNIDLAEHVNKKALEGIYLSMASHEADIRNNPARWATDNMKTVFGN